MGERKGKDWLDLLHEDPRLVDDRGHFEAASDLIKDIFGAEWLSRELSKPPRRKHELANWWNIGGIVSAWSIRGLAEDIGAVQDARKFDKILARLRSPIEFQSARYELHCAALVARAGEVNLEFAPDVPPGKADFAFDSEGQRIFNECKKLGISDAERAFLTLFGRLRDRINRIVSDSDSGFFEVRVRSMRLPGETAALPTISAVETLLKNYGGRFARVVSGPLEASVFPLRAQIRRQDYEPDIGPAGSMFSAPPPRVAFRPGLSGIELWTEFELTAGVYVESPWILYVECARDPRETTRIENILKGVARQLPRDAPNLLWLGTTQYQGHESIANELRKRFGRGLNRRLGGVMLTLPTVYRGADVLSWVDLLQFVEHPNPRTRLPEISYSPIGLVAQMKLQPDSFPFPADRYSLRLLYWKRVAAL